MEICTDGHGTMCTDEHSNMYVNATNEVDHYTNMTYSPGKTYIGPPKSYSPQYRKSILVAHTSPEDERCGQAYDGAVQISSSRSGLEGNALECPDGNFWSTLLKTSQISIQRRDFNNNTKKRARKKDKNNTKIIIPCGKNLRECGAKPRKIAYELPPLKGAPSDGESAQRSNVKVSEVVVGAHCSNIITPRENKNLESRLTYLDKTEYRPGFRAAAKKIQQKSNLTKNTSLSLKLPKLVENELKSKDYDQKNEKSLFKLPSIVGTTCLLDTTTKQNSQNTKRPEVSEDSGSTTCSLGKVKLPPIVPCVKEGNKENWKNKYRG
ncbi:uncharacterized protein LOC117325391 [Pecten maximus]|uniref:uncharacterized protein LOC117325391 n=1 Tax=Pecten maximus TaxID=6579 RepID=UPI0014586F67|nr:uncharacterized protein LOC117325391 [Pecten maximus]